MSLTCRSARVSLWYSRWSAALYSQVVGWELQGKTEQIHNNLNPDFHTSVHVLYSFEKVQKIRFDFIDVDNLGEYDTIGTVDTTIGEIMGSMA